MKCSTVYCSSGLVYAECTQEYILYLLSLYRLVLPYETVITHKPHFAVLFMRTDMAVVTCLFIWLHSEVCPVYMSVALPAAADIFKDSRQIYLNISNTLILCILFKRVRRALSLQTVLGAV